VALPKEPEEKPLPPIAYAAKGRRDPFRQPVTAIEGKGSMVASLKLVGILQGREGPMALVEGPDGLGYILRPGEPVGDGRLLEIGTDSVTFSVAGPPGQPPTRTVLRLKAD
jgi:Tfp pilus assembly protein PilP